MKPITIEAHTSPVRLVCFSPDGKGLFSTGTAGEIREWSVGSWSRIREYPGHTKQVNSIVFSPNGETVITGGDDAEIRWWDRAETPSGDGPVPVRTIRESRKRIESLFATPDGKYLLASTPQEIIVVISLSDGSVDRRIRSFAKRTAALDLSKLGTRLAIGGANGTVYLYSIPDASLVTSVKTGSKSVVGFVFCRDTRRALSLGSDAVLRIWDSADWHETGAVALDQPEPRHLTISPDGAVAAVASGRTVTLVDMEELAVSGSIELPEDALISAQSSAPGATLISADCASSIAFSPDEKLLAAGAPNGSVYVWKL